MPGRIVAVERRRDQAAVVEDEEDVHPAQLVDAPALDGVEEDHLVAAVLDRLGLGGQPRGVVAAALGRARAAGRRPGVLRDTHTVTGLTPPSKYDPTGEAMST